LKVEYWTSPPGPRWGIGVSSFAADPLDVAFSDGVTRFCCFVGWAGAPAPAAARPTAARPLRARATPRGRRSAATREGHDDVDWRRTDLRPETGDPPWG
jgi:hypothetical protein